MSKRVIVSLTDILFCPIIECRYEDYVSDPYYSSESFLFLYQLTSLTIIVKLPFKMYANDTSDL